MKQVAQAILKISGELAEELHQEIFNRTGKRIGITTRHINNGYCADFADAVWRALPKLRVHVLSDEDMNPSLEYSHTFIKVGAKYYDAQCPYGVTDWTQLPIFLEDEPPELDWGTSE